MSDELTLDTPDEDPRPTYPVIPPQQPDLFSVPRSMPPGKLKPKQAQAEGDGLELFRPPVAEPELPGEEGA